jgi:nuclear protein localization protein 4 homolog
MAMVAADLLEACILPHKMRVRPSTADRYIPEIWYKHKNAFGVEVRDNATPTFPVEYLLISMSHGFRKVDDGEAATTFQTSLPPYPSSFAGTSAVGRYPKSRAHLHDAAYLSFLSEIGCPDVCGLLQTGGVDTLWALVESMDAGLFASGAGGRAPATASASADIASSSTATPFAQWQCPHCTFINATGARDCEVCGLPPSGA